MASFLRKFAEEAENWLDAVDEQLADVVDNVGNSDSQQGDSDEEDGQIGLERMKRREKYDPSEYSRKEVDGAKQLEQSEDETIEKQETQNRFPAVKVSAANRVPSGLKKPKRRRPRDKSKLEAVAHEQEVEQPGLSFEDIQKFDAESYGKDVIEGDTLDSLTVDKPHQDDQMEESKGSAVTRPAESDLLDFGFSDEPQFAQTAVENADIVEAPAAKSDIGIARETTGESALSLSKITTEEVFDLNKKISELVKENESLHGKLERMEEEFSHFELVASSKVETTSKRLAEVKEELKVTKKFFVDREKELQDAIEDLTQEIGKVEDERDDALDKLEDESTMKDDLEQKLKDARDQLSRLKSSEEQVLEGLDEENSGLKSELEAVKLSLKNMQESFKAREAKYRQREEMLEDSNQQLITSLQEAKDELSRSKNEKVEQHTDLERLKELDNVKQENLNLSSQLEAIHADFEKLKANLKTMELKADQAGKLLLEERNTSAATARNMALEKERLLKEIRSLKENLESFASNTTHTNASLTNSSLLSKQKENEFSKIIMMKQQEIESLRSDKYSLSRRVLELEEENHRASSRYNLKENQSVAELELGVPSRTGGLRRRISKLKPIAQNKKLSKVADSVDDFCLVVGRRLYRRPEVRLMAISYIVILHLLLLKHILISG